MQDANDFFVVVIFRISNCEKLMKNAPLFLLGTNQYQPLEDNQPRDQRNQTWQPC